MSDSVQENPLELHAMEDPAIYLNLYLSSRSAPPPPSICLSLFLLGLLLALTHCNETQLLLKRKERVAVTALIKRLVLASRAEEALVSQRSCPIHHASHTPVQFYTQTHTGTHTAV